MRNGYIVGFRFISRMEIALIMTTCAVMNASASTEAAINGKNYSAASAAVIGGDKLSDRVWWDKE